MKLYFTRIEAYMNLYFKVKNDKSLILVLYVDDLFLKGADPLFYQCKRELASKFKRKDLGLMNYFLGLEVWKNLGGIFFLIFKKLCRIVVGPDLENPFEYIKLVGGFFS